MASYSETDMGSQWCKGIHNMYNRSCNGLNPEQHLQIAQLIDRNLTCFSSSPTDFGQTSILKHEINTGDAHIVCAPPGRPLLKAFEEKEKVNLNT